MHRPRLLVPAVLAILVFFPSSASAFLVAADGSGPTRVAVAADPAGGALLAWVAHPDDTDQALRVRERRADGTYGPTQELMRARSIGVPAVAVGPDGSALVLVSRATGATQVETGIVALRRPRSDAPFGPPTAVTEAKQYAVILSAAANTSGDVVAVAVTDRQGMALSTHTGDAPTTTTPLGPVGTAGVAVGDGGRVVVATYADGGRDINVRLGSVGAPLAPPRTLARLRSRPDLQAAVDAQGTATVAFSRDLAGNAIGVVAARARAGRAFGAPVVLDHGPNAQIAGVAAGGSRTAVAWENLTSAREPVRVAFARGPGGFDGVQAPGTRTVRLRGEAGRIASVAGFPVVAVSPGGDVLLAYPYGPFQAVHATVRRAEAARFTVPRVLTALGPGGVPTPAFLSGGKPFVATADGSAITAAARLDGPRPDLTPPAVTTTPLSVSELRSDGTVTTRVRCSAPCVAQASARITTGTGRPGAPAGQRISRQFRRAVVLQPAGTTLTIRFIAPARVRDAFARTGRASAKVIVTVANASGAARTSRRAFDVGRRP
jgi:hypothetical protein